MSLIRSLASATILSSVLVMGGCNKKDKDIAVEKGKSEIVNATKSHKLAFNAPKESHFNGYFDVKSTKVDTDDSEQALKKMHLWNESDAVSWDSRTGKNGHYTFKNLTIRDDEDDGEVTIKKAEIFGLRTSGDKTTFDKLDMEGITATDLEDGGVAKIQFLSLADPNEDFSLDIKNGDDLDIEDGQLGLGAFKMKGLNFTQDEDNVEVNLDQVIFGSDEDRETFDFKISGFDLTANDEEVGPISAKMGGFYGLGFNAQSLGNDGDDIRKSMEGFSSIGSKFASGKFFDHYAMDGLSIKSDFVTVNSDGLFGVAKRKGDVVTTRQQANPFTISFKDEPPMPEAKKLYDNLKKLDLLDIEISGRSEYELNEKKDTLRLKESVIDMKDGFRLTTNYDVTGLQSSLRAAEEAGYNDRDMRDAFQSVSMNEFYLRMEDKTLVERVLKLAAEMQGTSPGVIKTQIKAMLGIAAFAGKTELQKEASSMLLSALGEYLEGGKTLTVALDPDVPLTGKEAMNLMDSQKTAKELGLTIKAE